MYHSPCLHPQRKIPIRPKYPLHIESAWYFSLSSIQIIQLNLIFLHFLTFKLLFLILFNILFKSNLKFPSSSFKLPTPIHHPHSSSLILQNGKFCIWYKNIQINFKNVFKRKCTSSKYAGKHILRYIFCLYIIIPRRFIGFSSSQCMLMMYCLKLKLEINSHVIKLLLRSKIRNSFPLYTGNDLSFQ